MSDSDSALKLLLADGTPAEVAPWQVEGEFKKGKDLSGIACDPDGFGLVATDEGSLLQSFRLDRRARTLRVGAARAALLREGEEADFEGLCWDSGWFYAVGSHARGRKNSDHQPSRHHVYRARFTADGIGETETSHALGQFLGADALLAAHYHRALDQVERGIDVEGITVRDGTVQLGLRSPCLEEKAFLLEVAVADLFAHDPDREPEPRRHTLALGPVVGIRDLALVPNGVLVLSGPSVEGDTAPFALWHWGSAGLKQMAQFARSG